jgi:hypothetical protein
MAIYKIFPNADTSLYSFAPAKNTGLDEILEVSVKNTDNPTNFFVDPVPSTPILSDDIRRALITFSNKDIQTLNSLKQGDWKTNLKLYLANAENLTIPYTLEFRQIDDDWTMGTGKFSDNPETRNGACWFSTSSYYTASNQWSNPSYYLLAGGGSWGATYSTQSFAYKDNKDINVDVTDIVDNWFNGDNNYGILVKHTTSVENNNNSYIVLNYFSGDTHTIFPPCLELKWDDSSYDTGSLSLVQNNKIAVNVSNNPYNIKSTTAQYEFRITARDQFPVRIFSTASIYTTNKCLPSSSYWALQDVKTEDMIVDFDDSYTKISCDLDGNFFNLHMTGLEPERYYKILVKTTLNSGDTIVFDNDNIFKIVR